MVLTKYVLLWRRVVNLRLHNQRTLFVDTGRFSLKHRIMMTTTCTRCVAAPSGNSELAKGSQELGSRFAARSYITTFGSRLVAR